AKRHPWYRGLRREELSLPDYRDGENVTGQTGWPSRRLAVQAGDVPDAHGTICAGRGDGTAVGAVSQPIDVPQVAAEGRPLPAPGSLPDKPDAVHASRGDPAAVGADGHSVDGAGVTAEGNDFLASGQVPHLHFALHLGPDADRNQSLAVGVIG